MHKGGHSRPHTGYDDSRVSFYARIMNLTTYSDSYYFARVLKVGIAKLIYEAFLIPIDIRLFTVKLVNWARSRNVLQLRN